MDHKLKDLLVNFHSHGRRYSYYPSLPTWSGNDKKELIIESLNLTEVNLYIHIPYCPSLCTFCGCNIKITKSKEQFKSYIETLLKEWKSYKNTNPHISLSSIYLGGGTPTYLDIDDLKYLIDTIKADTPLSESFFGTVETDPRIEQRDKLTYLSEEGFNSISIGVQDTNEATLANVNRNQSFDQVRELVNFSRQVGFREVNLDLIYGLPFQTKETFKKAIEDVLSLTPDRIANYPLAKVPWQMDLQNALGIYRPLNVYDMYDLYILSDEVLKTNGYTLLGMGHYSQTNDTFNRNITGYTRAIDTSLIALGTSGISNTEDYLYQNDKILDKYIHSPELAIRSHKKTVKEKNLEYLFKQINCKSIIEKSLLSDCFTKEQLEKITKALVHLQNNNIIQSDSQKYEITNFGKHFNKTICQTFEIV